MSAQELLTPRGWTRGARRRGRRAWGPRRLATPLLTLRPNAFLDAAARCRCRRRARPSTSAAAAAATRPTPRQRCRPAGASTVDNHVGALGRARELAAACGLSVGFEGRDVRKERCLASLAAPQPLRLVHGCRFLHRPLLPTSSPPRSRPAAARLVQPFSTRAAPAARGRAPAAGCSAASCARRSRRAASRRSATRRASCTEGRVCARAILRGAGLGV